MVEFEPLLPHCYVQLVHEGGRQRVLLRLLGPLPSALGSVVYVVVQRRCLVILVLHVLPLHHQRRYEVLLYSAHYRLPLLDLRRLVFIDIFHRQLINDPVRVPLFVVILPNEYRFEGVQLLLLADHAHSVLMRSAHINVPQ